MNIRVCYPSCNGCLDLDANENNHLCTACKSGYFTVEDNKKNCMTKAEMIGSNYYFDEDAKIFKRCYKSCETCNAKSSINQHNYIKCTTSERKMY